MQRAVRQHSRTEDDALGSASVHPDLHDLSFGTLGPEQQYAGPSISWAPTLKHLGRNLQPPIRPSSDEEQDRYRGSLSDFSDYESSDGETHQRAGQSSSALHARKAHVNVSDDDEDPFADPFAD